MTKIKLINKINKASVSGLTMKRKFQLLTWSNERLERVLKAIQQINRRGQKIQSIIPYYSKPKRYYGKPKSRNDQTIS